MTGFIIIAEKYPGKYEPGQLRLVKVIDYLAGQKSASFTWRGAQFLFDMHHKTRQVPGNDALVAVVPVPETTTRFNRNR